MTINNIIEIPIIHEVRILEEQVQLPTVEEIKKYGLSIELKQALFNPNSKFNDNTNKVYCAFIDCPWSNSFQIEIYLQNFGNSRRWARESGQGTSLPGYWKTSPTGKYYWRSDLWLNHIGHAQDVVPLLTNDKVYTVNYTGLHCKEDNKFCNRAIEIIEDCIEEHRKYGATIKIKETIDSDVYKWNKWIIKTVSSTAAGFVLGPAALPIGAAAWGAGKLGEELCDDDQGKAFWNTVGGIGGDVALGEILGGLMSTASSSVASQTTKLIGHEAAREIAVNSGTITGSAKTLIFTGKTISVGQGLYKIYDAYDTYGKPIVDSAKHQEHILIGVNYQSDCEVCN